MRRRIASKTSDKKRVLKIWLDDERPMPKPYNIHVKTATEAIQLMREYSVSMISLDHDLGDQKSRWSDIYDQYKAVGSGSDVAKFIEQGAYEGSLRKMKWNVHSANPVGVASMTQALQNADKYWLKHKSEEPSDETTYRPETSNEEASEGSSPGTDQEGENSLP